MSVSGAGGRQGGRAILAAILIALAWVLVVPAGASAELFVVDSTADDADAALDGACMTSGGKCTLRAAIEESNNPLGEFDEIVFEEAIFTGQATGTIDLGESLPAVVAPVFINGRRCPTAAGVGGPCVGVDGPSDDSSLIVADVEGVEIAGLAITGAETGIRVERSDLFKVQASWLGIELDGSPGGDATGVFIGPESDDARVGGEGPEAGNVFAGNTDDGLHVHGASRAKVLGNYFGVEPDGATAAANAKDIEVTSTETLAAIGTAIGTRVSSEALATPECDGGCNLISGATSSGIDLQGDGGEEASAVSTAIAGNYIGLDATGTAPIPNVIAGVHVGAAAHTLIGGPSAAAANRINAGGSGILAGPGADGLAVRGNLIGADATGTGTLVPPDDGIVVDSGELPNPAAEAQIVDNEIRMDGGVAIVQQGDGAWIFGNVISGPETGIRTSGSSGHGNVIEGNLVEAPEINGILVESSFNEVFGNEVLDAGAAGILIQGSPPFGVSGNLIGGDTEADENFIAGSGGAAIEISNVKATENTVARNWGLANGGLFIDLVAASPETEPEGPNNGIEPPVFLSSTQVSAGGSGVEAGADVRVFRKQGAEGGELESFLGEAIADAEGNWEVVYDSAIPAGTIVAATQTREAGGTSELTTATTTGESGGGGTSGSSASAGQIDSPADKTPPQTKIVKAPKKKTHGSTARFRFDSAEPGVTFQCKLDRKPFRACKSPKRYRNLKPGKHVFKVRAIDSAGNADLSPAKRKFTVQR